MGRLADSVSSIIKLRDAIRTKLLGFEVITNESAKLSECTTAIQGIADTSLAVPSIEIAPTMSIEPTTGVVTASGASYGIANASKGYCKGLSSRVTAKATNTLQLDVYDGKYT